MAVGKGALARAGFKKSTTWGTAVLLGATNGVEFVSEGLTPDAQLIPDEQVSGSITRLFGDKGNEFHSGPIVLDAKYEGIETLIAMAQGTAGVPTQVGADNAYKHVFKIADSVDGKHVTFGIAKQVRFWEYPTCKVGGFSLQAQNGRRARWTFPLIPQTLNRNTVGGTNNNTTASTITLPANRDFMLFKDMKVRINLHDGIALDDTHLVYISEFGVESTRNFETDDVTTQYGYLIDEPVGDSWTDLMGTMNFSKYNDNAGGNDALVEALISKTRWKMTVTWTGPAIGATTFKCTMYFPDIQFESGDVNVGGPQRIPANLKFRANRRLTVPTGFPATYTDPVTIEIINQRNTDALA
jgi:hypothetical protein